MNNNTSDSGDYYDWIKNYAMAYIVYQELNVIYFIVGLQKWVLIYHKKFVRLLSGSTCKKKIQTSKYKFPLLHGQLQHLHDI